MNTEAGFAYRVDLRLRPEGQKGAIALALRGYEIYYESWGRAWERAMLIRARPAAGDATLGRGFIEMIRPFVYRKYLDYSAIDEIRSLKTRIDSTFKKGDIKRGYGGIREIEFFVQALQLMYGGREPLIRERNILKALHRLLQKSLVGQEDYYELSIHYRYLRELEHRLQQMNDLQTHMLPSGKADIEALGRKMGCSGGSAFLSDLEKRRRDVRAIYDSLFSGAKGGQPQTGTFFEEDLSDAELKEYLSGTGLNDINKAVRNIKDIRDSTLTFQTLRGRRLLGEILPIFIDSALKSGAPDAALNHLQSFAALLSINESYIEIFSKDKRLIHTLTYLFAQSGYLSRLLIGRPQYLETLGWEKPEGKGLLRLCNEDRVGRLGRTLAERRGEDLETDRGDKARTPFSSEGYRCLSGDEGIKQDRRGDTKGLHEKHPGRGGGLAVIGFGKLGGREITFGSDLDVIFVTPDEVSLTDTRAAERFLRMLISYTREGIAYRVDTRLRPEGSEGASLSSVESFRKYYAGPAAFLGIPGTPQGKACGGKPGYGAAFYGNGKRCSCGAGQGNSGFRHCFHEGADHARAFQGIGRV